MSFRESAANFRHRVDRVVKEDWGLFPPDSFVPTPVDQLRAREDERIDNDTQRNMKAIGAMAAIGTYHIPSSATAEARREDTPESKAEL